MRHLKEIKKPKKQLVLQVFEKLFFVNNTENWRIVILRPYLASASCHITIFNFFSMYTGTVKFFNESKGFGFVVDNSSKEEVFTSR